MKIVLLGPPGSGKGSHSEYLQKHYKIAHISTGDIFREAIRKKTPFGMRAKSLIDKGNYVPDDITISLVKERLSELDCKNGYILDGFPRTLIQAQELNNFNKPDIVIYLNTELDVALKRLLSRRVCKNCGTIYNTATYDKDYCAKCGGQLITRDDDNQKTIINRFSVYKESTAPLIKYYKEVGLLTEISANGTVDEVNQELFKLLGETNEQ